MKNIIMEKEAFDRTYIEQRMAMAGFNSIAKFELFIWDLEMFLQLQRKLANDFQSLYLRKAVNRKKADKIYNSRGAGRATWRLYHICEANFAHLCRLRRHALIKYTIGNHTITTTRRPT